MKEKHWLVRAGALLILLGFVLPSMSVSCSGMGVSQSYSFSDIASQFETPLLYLAPIGALVVLILAFLPSSANLQPIVSYWGQVAGTVAGVVGILIPMMNLNSQLKQYNFNLEPEFGLFLLLGGFILVGIGLGMQWSELGVSQSPGNNYLPDVRHQPDPYYVDSQSPPLIFDTPLLRGWLQVNRGGTSMSVIRLENDNFSIGRDSANDLPLSDPTVSRQHVRLRYAQGNWFIQDLGSTSGTYVNSKPVQAKKLEAGDEISIGETVLTFHCD